MEFLFHSVYQEDDQHAKYFSIYKVDENRFFAECHHFNMARICEGDFEIARNGDSWEPSEIQFQKEADFIGSEINSHYSIEPTPSPV